MLIRDRIKEFRRVPARLLRPNPHNWRTHPQRQRDALRGVLAQIGYADALLVRELPDGQLELLDGHLRAETTPEADVPVLILDLDDREASIGIGIGVLTSAVVIGFVVNSLNVGNTTYRPVEYPEFTAPADADGKSQTGPDGQSYKIVYVPEDLANVQRGKYLADASGKLRFLVDPGIAGGFPYRLEKAGFPGVVDPQWTERPGGRRTSAAPAATQRIAELHGGKLTIEDAGQEGCRLVLTLPRQQ